MIGNGVFRIALPLEVLRLSGRTTDLALVLGAQRVPALFFNRLGGALADPIPVQLTPQTRLHAIRRAATAAGTGSSS
jgi:hypothetical protein